MVDDGRELGARCTGRVVLWCVDLLSLAVVFSWGVSGRGMLWRVGETGQEGGNNGLVKN